MKKDRSSLLLLLLYGVLIAALLILAAAGAKLYSHVLAARQVHSHQRLALSYVQSQAAGFSGDRVILAEGPEGTMLCLKEADGTFETRIYYYAGSLRTEFCPVERACNPEGSQRICDLESFELTREGNLLRIVTDCGESVICCYGGAAHE